MTESPMLGPVVSATAGTVSSKRRSDPRKRPSKSLPTDRMKFEAQVRVLEAAGRLSGAGKRAIDSKQLSAAMGGEVSHYTVGLSHQFFVDCGWLEKRGRGEYAASDALIDFTRRLGVDGDDLPRAVEALRVPLAHSWFWRAIEPQLAHGSVPVNEIMVVLMQEAEVGSAHIPQIRNVLEWLRLAGLISIVDDRVGPTDGSAPSVSGEPNVDIVTPTPQSKGAPILEDQSALTVRATPVTPPPAPPPALPSVLSFDFSFKLTVADLASLSPEQIRSLFEAVGTVMSVKALL
jgi:hypothetical protein